jgi:hypothetical protein
MQMRRVAMLALAFLLTLSGFGGAEAGGGAAASARAARGAAHAGRWLGTVPARILRFAGYAISVPAAWPVYRLDRNPSQCVRYDRHAVYLGQPGPDQLCPAHLVGRVDTISVRADGSPAPPGPAAAWRQAPAAFAPGRGLRQAGGQVLQDAQDHQVMATASRPGLTISATYGANAALVTRIIRSARPVEGTSALPPRQRAQEPRRPAPQQAVPPPQAAAARPLALPGTAAGQEAAARAAAKQRSAKQRSAKQRSAKQRSAGQAAAARHGRWVRRGFDTCTAPSLSAMRKWRRHFSAMAVYIGGPEAACGWALIPTYVGRQAPCNPFHMRIRPRHSFAEGRAAARQAARLAAALGMGRHAPIYDDMEAYHHLRARCRRPVLSFLNGWTRQLHAWGHRAGVYSSAGSAVTDLRQARWVYGRRLVKPDAIWFGLWDGRCNLAGAPYVPASWWPAGHRIKQWRGAHWRRIGGVSLNIDSDLVAGPVYRLGGLAVALAAGWARRLLAPGCSPLLAGLPCGCGWPAVWLRHPAAGGLTGG